MPLKKLIETNRSYRRFNQDYEISFNDLRELIDLARLSPSASNLQPLRYIVSHYPEKNALIYNHLTWAGYLKDWDGPENGERPSAYIIILSDMKISKKVDCDHGIAAQSILLGAVEKGLGGCMLSAVNREGLRIALDIPVTYEILLVIALGKPKEKIELDPLKSDGDIKYWRDDAGTHHVPKRSLRDIILDL